MDLDDAEKEVIVELANKHLFLGEKVCRDNREDSLYYLYTDLFPFKIASPADGGPPVPRKAGPGLFQGDTLQDVKGGARNDYPLQFSETTKGRNKKIIISEEMLAGSDVASFDLSEDNNLYHVDTAPMSLITASLFGEMGLTKKSDIEDPRDGYIYSPKVNDRSLNQERIFGENGMAATVEGTYKRVTMTDAITLFPWSFRVSTNDDGLDEDNSMEIVCCLEGAVTQKNISRPGRAVQSTSPDLIGLFNLLVSKRGVCCVQAKVNLNSLTCFCWESFFLIIRVKRNSPNSTRSTKV